MTEKVKKCREFLLGREYRKRRNPERPENLPEDLGAQSEEEQYFRLFERAAENEKPLFYESDDFGFNRYRARLPQDEVWRSRGGNLTVDYETFLAVGLSGLRAKILERLPAADAEAKRFYDLSLRYLRVCGNLAEKWRKGAEEAGRERLAAALAVVPENGASTYYHALVSLRFLHYVLRLNGNDHLTLGRFDRYMLPYAEESVRRGVSLGELTEDTELFFIAMNYDTDLYRGIQQGDNGQSLVLGGCDENGENSFSFLSEIALTASEELALIDPKINLRVNSETPAELYERASRLTRQGLGFPQYCNDDAAIKGLVRLGYDPIDARNYAVAACWEIIVPRCGADVPNIDKLIFPEVVRQVTLSKLIGSESYAEFEREVKSAIEAGCDKITERCNVAAQPRDALISIFVSPCIERGRYAFEGGAKYNNYGVHGVGLSNAADALEAIKKAVFEEKTAGKAELVSALETNFAGREDLRQTLLSQPKTGNNNEADERLCFLMETFSSYLNNKPNCRGGVYRAGTGSAMEYVVSAAGVGATADGRKAGEAFASSFSPSLAAKTDGPFSTILSFTKFDMSKIINGGPLTMELYSGVFRNGEGLKKVALLVKAFIDRGGHQLQLNAVNRETLLDAQAHPEKYPNLIVRVWGWSGYFVELDRAYQNHVIARTEYGT